MIAGARSFLSGQSTAVYCPAPCTAKRCSSNQFSLLISNSESISDGRKRFPINKLALQKQAASGENVTVQLQAAKSIADSKTQQKKNSLFFSLVVAGP